MDVDDRHQMDVGESSICPYLMRAIGPFDLEKENASIYNKIRALLTENLDGRFSVDREFRV